MEGSEFYQSRTSFPGGSPEGHSGNREISTFQFHYLKELWGVMREAVGNYGESLAVLRRIRAC